jgi:hypothetical protein
LCTTKSTHHCGLNISLNATKTPPVLMLPYGLIDIARLFYSLATGGRAENVANKHFRMGSAGPVSIRTPSQDGTPQICNNLLQVTP